MSQRYPIIRVFISSTFEDFREERNVLHNIVFPPLRQYCLEQGARFLPIDLRWGISPQASNDQYIVRQCLEEVRRCQESSPFFHFMALVGDRYGSRLLPESIPQSDFTALVRHLTADEGKLAERWSQLDTNSIPESYVLRSRDSGNWRRESPVLQEALLRAAQKAAIGALTLLRLTKSITEQEIDAGIFRSPTGSEQTVIHRRFTTDNVPERFRTSLADAAQLLATLQQRLYAHCGSGIHGYEAAIQNGRIEPASLALFGRDTRDILQRRIDTALAQFHKQRQDPDEEFAHERLLHYVPQVDALQQIERYLDRSADTPLMISGESGIGKTTFMLEAVAGAKSRYANIAPVTYFIGGSTTVATVSDLLIELETAISSRYHLNVADIPSGRIELENYLIQLLDKASAGNPLLIFIDALDQLQEDQHLTRWIPAHLPPHVHLVISILPGSALSLLQQRVPSVSPMVLEAPGDEEAMRLFDNWMSDRQRTVTAHQRSLIRDYYDHNRNPLALRVVVEIARQWASWDESASLSPKGTTELIDDWLHSLEDNRRHGRILPPYLLGLIGAGRHGLTEDELLGVINEHQDFVRTVTNSQNFVPSTTIFPPVLWARFYSEIAWMLTERQVDKAPVLNFYHRQFREAIERHARRRYHRDIAHYFRRNQNPPYFVNTRNLPRAVVNERMVSELAYQYAKSGQVRKLKTLLFDAEFLQARVQAGKTREVLLDLGYIPDSAQVRLLHETLSLSQPILDVSPMELPNQINGRSSTLASLMHNWADWPDPHLRLESHTLVQPGNSAEFTRRHHNVVNTCSFNHDGTRVLSSSKDGTAREWNAQTGECLAVFQGHEGNVRTCAFNPTGTRVVTGADDANVKIWDPTHSDVPIKTLEEHKGSIRKCLYSPDGRYVASASADGTALVWDTETGETHHLRGHDGQVNTCAFSHDGRLLLTGSDDKTVRIWDWQNDQQVHCLNGHVQAVRVSLFSADDALLVSGSDDNTLRVWDVGTGRQLHVLTGHEGRINDAAFSPTDADVLVSASEDRSLRLWNFRLGTALAVMNDYAGAVRACCMSPDGNLVIAAIPGNVLAVWDCRASPPKLLHKLAGHMGGLNACAVSPDGTLASSCSDDSTIIVWDLTHMKAKLVLGGGKPLIRACSASADGQELAVGDTDGSLSLLDVPNQRKRSWKAHAPRWVRCCAFSPDGTYLLSGSDDMTLKLWRRTREQGESYILEHEFREHQAPIRCCRFSHDGRSFLSAGGEGERDNTIRIWDTKSRQLAAELHGDRHGIRGHQFVVMDCCFSPDDNTIYSVSYDGTVRQWTWRDQEYTSELVATLSDGASAIDAVELRTCDVREDGAYLLIGGREGQTKIGYMGVIDLQTKAVVCQFPPHAEMVNTCRFIANSPYVASAAADRVKVWNIETRECLIDWHGDDRTIILLEIDQAHRRVFAAENDALHTLAFVQPVSQPGPIVDRSRWRIWRKLFP